MEGIDIVRQKYVYIHETTGQNPPQKNHLLFFTGFVHQNILTNFDSKNTLLLLYANKKIKVMSFS